MIDCIVLHMHIDVFFVCVTHLCTCASHSEAKAKVQDAGDFVLSLFASVYQSKIQPVAESYSEWASNVKESLTEKIQTTVSSYM